MRGIGWFLAVVAMLAGTATQGATVSERPRLTVEEDQGVYSIWAQVVPVGESPVSRLLRVTDTRPVLGSTGLDPDGHAAFATWTEAGERWFAYTRDAGRTWSEARPLAMELRLRAGAISPGTPMPAAPAGLTAPDDGRIFLVQFKTVSLPEWRAALAQRGAEILGFFPRNAHVVRLAPALVPQVESLDFVERVERYQPAYRLEPQLLGWLDGAPDALENEVGELRVRVWAFEWGPAAKARIAEAAQALGARVAATWPSGHVLELWVDRDQLRAIAFHDDVMWIDRWGPPGTDMDLVRQDAGTDWIESNFGYCGQGVRGEVFDTGLESTHMDFDGILLHGPNTAASHGTSTYGIVFGNGNRDGDGNAQGTGHMPCSQAQGIAADFDFLTDRFAHTQELKGSPYFASFQTNSWGNSLTTAYNTYSAEMDDIIWRLDIAITQSQSNNGNQLSRPQAWAKNIISVGGIRHYNTLDTSDDRWNFGASIGPAADGRIKPDLDYWYDSIFTTTLGNTYTSSFGGTSAATPEVAGVLGLIVQMWSDNVWGTNPVGSTVFERQPHFSTIKALLINNAQQYPFSGTTSDLTRTHQGWGRPSARVAKERAARSFVVDESDVLTVGQTATYGVVVAPGESELKVTMVYPDPPGTTSSTLHRINDLDLTVTSPSNVVYHGNVGLDAGNYSTPGGSANGVDTVENVFVANPEAGTWIVAVTAAEINQDAYLASGEDDAAFALVVTGAVAGGGECGNDVREPGEQCDGPDLGAATCQAAGCAGGTLACTAAGQAGECTYDLSGCTGCPSCNDNGVCETLENCFTCPGDCRSGTSAACGNAVCETADGENCENCPQDCNGKSGGKPDLRYCCSDGTGVSNPVTCADSRCDQSGNSCLSGPALDSCCGDATCEGDETSANCAVDCGPPASCGDGVCSGTEDSCGCPGDCGAPPQAEIPNQTCADGADNDCDGAIDCADADCATDPACSCLSLGTSCNFDIECCSGKCRGPAGGKVCK